MITCALCEGEHLPLWKDDPALSHHYKQGIDCAAIIYHKPAEPTKWRLIGCYGSAYDLYLFEVVDPLLRRPIDPICDACIRALLNTEKIKFIAEVDINGDIIR